MNKALIFIACALFSTQLFAQEPVPVKKKKEKIDLSNRANDHFVFQLGMAGWNGTPDTINKSGFSKTVNLYLMMDYPFKTNPNLSIGFGAGIASDHILFTKTDVLNGERRMTPPFKLNLKCKASKCRGKTPPVLTIWSKMRH